MDLFRRCVPPLMREIARQGKTAWEALVMDSLARTIQSAAARLLAHRSFEKWISEATPNEGDLIQVNNSFVFRSEVKTIKNENYLFLPISSGGVPEPSPRVGRGPGLNNDFKLISSNSKNFLTPHRVEDAVLVQLRELGQLVFILVGSIADDVPITEPTGHRLLGDVILDPKLSSEMEVEEGCIRVRDIRDPEAIWDEIVEHIEMPSIEEQETMKDRLAGALEKIEQSAYARLVLPSEGRTPGATMLSEIVAVIKQQQQIYEEAINKCQGDPHLDPIAFNEVLRIAYNFASDVTGLIRLVVSVCDLKPIVLWGTIAEHYALSEAFRELPWVRSKSKPSLKLYADTIGDARNNAFHHLFPFRKSVEVQLEDGGLQDITLRLFSDFRRKKENDLSFRDKELVQVLTEFTRSGEKRVPLNFWRKNLKLMNATIELFQSTESWLKELAEVQFSTSKLDKTSA